MAHAVSELHHGAQDLLPLGRGGPFRRSGQVAACRPGLLELVRVAQRDLFRAGGKFPLLLGSGSPSRRDAACTAKCERLLGG